MDTRLGMDRVRCNREGNKGRAVMLEYMVFRTMVKIHSGDEENAWRVSFRDLRLARDWNVREREGGVWVINIARAVVVCVLFVLCSVLYHHFISYCTEVGGTNGAEFFVLARMWCTTGTVCPGLYTKELG